MDKVEAKESHLECHYCEFHKAGSGYRCPAFEGAFMYFEAGKTMPSGYTAEQMREDFSMVFSCNMQKERK